MTDNRNLPAKPIDFDTLRALKSGEFCNQTGLTKLEQAAISIFSAMISDGSIEFDSDAKAAVQMAHNLFDELEKTND